MMSKVYKKEEQTKKNDWTELYKKYKGLWVVLAEDEQTVISSSLKLKDAVYKAEEKGCNDPIVFKVPANQNILVASF